MINSKTSFLALIGNPVEHSLSPIMHNAALKYLNIDLVYLALPCKNDDFEIVVNTLKKINCKGLNITIPFKERAFKLCKEISPIAEKVKAVNTLILNREGEWIGTNTDCEGLIYPLKKLKIRNKEALILGSGGAARSAIQGLINMNFSNINIISRNKTSLNKIICDFQNNCSLQSFLSNDIKIPNLMNTADLIINTTPVGMNKVSEHEKQLPFGRDFWSNLNSNTIIYDLIYNPKPTFLLRFAEKHGCHTIDGSEMLIAQGAKSLSYWTNIEDIPHEIMRNSIKNYL